MAKEVTQTKRPIMFHRTDEATEYLTRQGMSPEHIASMRGGEIMILATVAHLAERVEELEAQASVLNDPEQLSSMLTNMFAGGLGM